VAENPRSVAAIHGLLVLGFILVLFDIVTDEV
jgi:hypothetical protein